MNYKIEKDVEIPAGGGRNIYPFPVMEVGDCFLATDERGYNGVVAAAHSYGSKHGMRFRTSTDHISRTVRVWRSE